MIFDTHAHYDDAAFDADREELLASLPEKGVGLVVNIGTDLRSSRLSLDMAERFPHVYASAGVHPHCAKDYAGTDLGWIRDLAAREKCVAIGEAGLDYHYDNSPRSEQREVFAAQLALARELSMPVVIHEREAFSDAVDILKAFPGVLCVFHCFAGDVRDAKKVLDMGCYISLGGAITFKNAKNPPAVMAYVPADRLMLETDCPYMAPVPHRGRRNDSAYLGIVARHGADLRGCTPEELIAQTAKNGKIFFGIK